jgi:hypothetical protein
MGPARRCAVAGLAYFALVFLLGSMVGIIRILLVAPLLGPVGATLVELPVMLLLSWLVCRALVRGLAVPAEADARLLMGSLAFLLPMSAEYGLASLLNGEGLGPYLSSYRGTARQIGLVGQLAFAAIPMLQAVQARRRARSFR